MESHPPGVSSVSLLPLGGDSGPVFTHPSHGVEHPPLSRSAPSDFSDHPFPPSSVSTSLSELSIFCLLAKLWGDSVPLPLIISKTKLDWKHVKGPVDYIDIRNGWFLLKFSTIADRDYVWVNRPWFVKGLNLVLTSWIPFFDPYTTPITNINQWVHISRLPWEFWEEFTLISLLHPIGSVIRIDHNIFLRKKGRFGLVCVNVDVTKPLPGTLSIPTPSTQLSIPITYEGLHEVCTLCGASDHLLELFPSLPVPPKIKVKVEQLQAYGLLTRPLPRDLLIALLLLVS